jgi:APA family basic amino acid/polyamine antiporter
MEHGPKRTLGAGAALSLVAGSMLGIGIFIAPPVVAEHVRRADLFLLMWFLGGASAVAGALSLAELGAMMPRAGGDYPYVRLAFGPRVAFAVGWLQLLAIFPGSLATMAVGTATFQLPALLNAETSPAVGAMVIVVSLTLLNHLGVAVSGRVQVVVTAVPVAALAGVSAWVLFSGSASHAPSQAPLAPAAPWSEISAAAVAQAYLPVYFAYSGWYAAIFVGGEVRDPARNLPLALVGGAGLVAVLYLVVCAGYLAVFPVERLAGLGEAGTATAVALFGTAGERAIIWLIFLAMLGSINGTVLVGSRIAWAMAHQRQCFAAAGFTSRRFGTPAVALWAQCAWTGALVASQTFEMLMEITAVAMLVTGSLTVAAVLRLRRTHAELPRPYRVRPYPWAPLAYLVASTATLGILVVQGHASVGWAVGWFLAAWAGHRLLAR